MQIIKDVARRRIESHKQSNEATDEPGKVINLNFNSISMLLVPRNDGVRQEIVRSKRRTVQKRNADDVAIRVHDDANGHGAFSRISSVN